MSENQIKIATLVYVIAFIYGCYRLIKKRMALKKAMLEIEEENLDEIDLEDDDKEFDFDDFEDLELPKLHIDALRVLFRCDVDTFVDERIMKMEGVDLSALNERQQEATVLLLKALIGYLVEEALVEEKSFLMLRYMIDKCDAGAYEDAVDMVMNEYEEKYYFCNTTFYAHYRKYHRLCLSITEQAEVIREAYIIADKIVEKLFCNLSDRNYYCHPIHFKGPVSLSEAYQEKQKQWNDEAEQVMEV